MQLSEEHSCIGFIELKTIAKGLEVTDTLLKKASVRILFANPTSSGKYLTCFYGEVEEVRSALAAGMEMGSKKILDSFLIPSIHPQVIRALQDKISVVAIDALGILETATCAACIVAADTALKTSQVQLIQLHLAKGIGGRAYMIIEGEVGEINAAMLHAVRKINRQLIVDQTIIPHATSDLLSIFQ